VTAVGILGAGLSGVLAGISLLRAGVRDFVIYESQSDVGGTWLRNTYPGLHCDIPSHLFCYSFEPNPDFSTVYAGQEEIQAYLRTCAEKYNVTEHIRFNTTAETAVLDEAKGTWTLELADGSVARHRVLIAATGGLTAPHYPRIEGFDSFEGMVWHSGAWRHDVDLSDLKVAVIGSAASAIQVVPEVAKQAAKVVIFSRTPNWIIPRRNRSYSAADKAALRHPSNWRRTRRRQYRASMLWHHAFIKRGRAIELLRGSVMEQMRASIDDPALIAALTPNYELGCKRILVSDDYYPTLAKPHVELVPHGVTAMTPTSLLAANDSEHRVDAAIFCTGYKLGGREDGRPPLAVRGRGGLSLRRAYAEAPEAYRGVAVPRFPNYFTVCGVNGAAGHAPVFLSAELGVDFIVRWVRKILDRNLKLVEPNLAVTRRYNTAIQAELQSMSWGGECPGWYRDKQGRVVPFHPGSFGRMRRELRDDHEADFDIELQRSAQGTTGTG